MTKDPTTFDADTVSLHGFNGHLDLVVVGFESRNLDILPIDGKIGGLENLLDAVDEFWSHSITWYHGDGVAPAISRRPRIQWRLEKKIREKWARQAAIDLPPEWRWILPCCTAVRTCAKQHEIT